MDYRVAKSVNDGIGAVITGKADIACGVAFTWGRSTQVTYSLPFGIGGTRLLMADDTTVDGTPASLEGQTIGVVKDTASARGHRPDVRPLPAGAGQEHQPGEFQDRRQQGSTGHWIQLPDLRSGLPLIAQLLSNPLLRVVGSCELHLERILRFTTL